MHILLAATNLCTDPYPVYPLGMAVIAGALTQAGHCVRQFDLLTAGGDVDAFRAALAEPVDAVCLSIRNLDDAYMATGGMAVALAMVQAARAATSAPVIIGGPAVSILPEAVRTHLGADYAVVGEGETILVDLLAALARGERLPPVQTARVALCGADQAAPLYDPTFASHYFRTSGMLNVQTKRGCPFQCGYCTYPQLEGNAYRPRPVDAVVADLARLHRDTGADTFFLTDAVFNDAEGQFLLLAEALVRAALPIRWSTYFTPRGLTRDHLALCQKAGLYALELGTDAACDTTLASLHKAFTFADVEAANAACAELRLPVAHFIIFGAPGETPLTVAESLANLQRLHHSVVFASIGLHITPGTAIHRRALAEGLITPDADLLQPRTYLAPTIDPDWLHAQLLAAFRGKRDRIYPPEAGQHKLKILQQTFGLRGVIWDGLIRY